MKDIKEDHFYVGDVVELVRDIGRYNAGARGTIIRVANRNNNVVPYSPMGGEDNYIRVQLDNYNKTEGVWFPHRIKLVHRKLEEAVVIPAKPPVIDIAPIVEQAIMPQEFEGFQVGDKVFCQNSNHPRLVKDYPYTVVQVYANNLIRLVGIPSLWSTRHFTVLKREVAPVPMQKPELSLNERLAKKQLNGLCNFAIEFKTHGRKFYTDSPCHANLGFPYDKALREDVVLAVACNVSRDYQKSPHQKGYVEFIQYILQESPWAKYYIPKPLEDILKDGVELDVSKPGNEVVAAAIALRLPWEYSQSIPKYKMALELGFSKTLAFLVFQFSRPNGDGIQYHLHSGGHNVLSSAIATKDLVSFFNNGYESELLEPYSSSHGRYRITSLLGGESVKSFSNDVITSKFSKKVEDRYGMLMIVPNGNSLEAQVANMCNCFLSLGFK